MICLKRTLTFITAVMLLSVNSIAQQKSDIGILISPFSPRMIAFEYRVPLKKNEKYLLKYGVSHTQDYYFNAYDPEIIAGNDSTVMARRLGNNKSSFEFRFGAERRLKESMFSLFADVNVGYRQQKLFYNSFTYQLLDEEWVIPSSNAFWPGEDPSQSRVTRHFISTNLRLGAAANIPLGNHFLLNLYAGGSFGLPIYVGESSKIGPEDDFAAVGTTFDFRTDLGIGVRYKIGVNK